MGIQGNKSTEKAAEFCEEILSRLSVIPGVTSRKQFGGHGLFQDRKMFGIVSSKAELFFKVDDVTLPNYRKARAPQHGKMPYYRVPKTVITDNAKLIEWARQSVAASKG